MEMLDSDDPVKSQLLRKSAQHREQIEEDVKIISERTEKIIINALVIGGALAATYFIVSRFSRSKAKKKSKVRKIKIVNEPSKDVEAVEDSAPEEPGVFAQIGSAIASQATVLLLSLAKEKLAEFLKADTDKQEKKDENN